MLKPSLNISLHRFAKFLKTGNRLYLGLFANEKDAQKIVELYMDGVGDKKYKAFQNKKDELISRKHKYMIVSSWYYLTFCKSTREEAIEKLKELKGDEKKSLAWLKSEKIGIEIMQKEYDDFIASQSKDKEERKDHYDAIFENMMALSKYVAYRMTMKNTTLKEYITLMQMSSKEVEAYERNTKKNG